MDKNFKLYYSPLFYEDLDKITDYILLELNNTTAAKKLINDVEAAIKNCLKNPTLAAVYRPSAVQGQQYRRIIVGSYLIFYVVIDNSMVVRRMLYGRMDIHKIL